MKFEVISLVEQVEAIASGTNVKARSVLRKLYGPGRWRQLKGVATVRLKSGKVHRVELHWHEAHGIGRRDLKIKRCLDKT